jgi:methylmalonyl-CoA carboxyltransferase 1.3S subunit
MDAARTGDSSLLSQPAIEKMSGRKRLRKGTGSLKLQIKINGKTYKAEVEVLEDDESTRQAGTRPHQQAPIVSHPMPAPGAYTPSATNGGIDAKEKIYRSPLTGLVIKVNVKPGQKVEANDLIMVLEAMKMETSITAHHAGRIKSVSVKPGDSVKLHQVLVEFA